MAINFSKRFAEIISSVTESPLVKIGRSLFERNKQKKEEEEREPIPIFKDFKAPRTDQERGFGSLGSRQPTDTRSTTQAFTPREEVESNRERITSRFKGSLAEKPVEALSKVPLVGESLAGAASGVKAGLDFFFPGRRQLAEEVRNESEEELSPSELAKRVIEKEGELFRVSGTTKLPETDEDLEKFLNTEFPFMKPVDPTFGVSGVKSVGAKATKAVEQKIIDKFVKNNIAKAEKTGPLQKARDFFDTIYEKSIDRFNALTKLGRAKKVVVTPGQDPATIARRYLGTKGIAESQLFWKTNKFNPSTGNVEVTGESLSSIVNRAGNKFDDVTAFMKAERDIELAARNIKGANIKSSKELIKAVNAKYGQATAEISKLADDIRKFTIRAHMDPLVDSGLLSKEARTRILTKNKKFISFKKAIDKVEGIQTLPTGFQVKGTGLKRITGSEGKIIDPRESLIGETYRVAEVVARHNVGKSIVELAKRDPNGVGKLVTKTKAPIEKKAVEDGKKIFRPAPFHPEKNIIKVFEDGKPQFYKVPDDIGRIFDDMGTQDVSTFTKLMSPAARGLRAGAILTPEFFGRNPFRDQFTAMFNAKYGFVPGVDLAKGVFELFRPSKGLYGRWLASGGAQSTLVSMDRLANKKTFDALQKKALAIKIAGAPLKVVRHPIEALRNVSDVAESGTRLGAFRKAKKKGASDIEAALESREVTLDFARRGSKTKDLNQISAFWNANVQDKDKIARTFKNHPVRSLARGILGITLPTIGLFIKNKENERYWEIPEWVRDVYWVADVDPYPNDWVSMSSKEQADWTKENPPILLPKPFTLGTIFATLPEKIMEFIYKDEPEALTSLGQLGVNELESLVPIPTALVPVAEVGSNYDFFRNRPIVSQSISNLPPELQDKPFTSETAKEIGKLIKQSPAKLEHLVRGYFAGLGRYSLDTSDVLLNAAGITSPVPRPEKTAADIPFIRGFVAREPLGPSGESLNKFYEMLNEAEISKGRAENILKEEGAEKYAAYVKEHKEILVVKSMNKLARDIADIRKRKDVVLRSRDIDPEKKRELLQVFDLLMTDNAKQAIALLESVK